MVGNVVSTISCQSNPAVVGYEGGSQYRSLKYVNSTPRVCGGGGSLKQYEILRGFFRERMRPRLNMVSFRIIL